MTGHSIVHLEFSAKDPKAAGEFYKQLFGWKVEYMEEMDYVTYAIDESSGGGFLDTADQNFSAGDIIPYISTSDIEASLAKAESLGGKTLLPKTEIPGIGWYAFFADPTGNRVGLYTSRGQE
jgi:predicted enzyme related to lactoylglutathione lyase